MHVGDEKCERNLIRKRKEINDLELLAVDGRKTQESIL